MLSYYSASGGDTPILEALKAALLGIGGLGVASTIILSILNSMEDRRSKVIENTYIHITKWDDPHLAAARMFTRKLKETKPTMSDDDFLKHIEGDENLKHSIVLVCNYFEQVRISYLMNRIDIKLFNKSLGPVMSDYYYRLRPYVESQKNLGYIQDWDNLLALTKII